MHECTRCGGMVHDIQTHDEFHDGLEAAADLIQKIMAAMPPANLKEEKE
jgi:hypothetical protein